MIATIWPEESHLEETISTLRFAQRMMKVQNDLSVNIQLDPDILLKKYERQIKDLKLELAMHDTLAGRGRVSYEPYSREQQYEQQQIAEKFLKGEAEDIDIGSIRQVKELFFQFRNLYRNVLRQVEDSDKIGSPLKPAASVV
jgi:kinesin family protein 6/9